MIMFIFVFKSKTLSEKLVSTSSCYSSDINEDLTLLLVPLFHPIRPGGPSGFSKSLHRALDWSKKHVGDNLCTTSFSQQYPPHKSLPYQPPLHPFQPHQKKEKDLSGRLYFEKFPHTLPSQSNKVTKHPRQRNHRPSQPIHTMNG